MIYLVKANGRTITQHRLKARAVVSQKQHKNSYIIARKELYPRDR